MYDYDKLAAGNVVAGPAIIDSDSTTYVLPANASLTVDAYRNGVIALGGDGARTPARGGPCETADHRVPGHRPRHRDVVLPLLRRALGPAPGSRTRRGAWSPSATPPRCTTPG